jgi:septum formation protein
MPVDILLASASPRRHDLIRRLGLSWQVMPAQVDEDALTSSFIGPAGAVAIHLARHKAHAVAQRALAGVPVPACVVLAADTTVILDGELLGKPRDAGDAQSMLRRLRGRTHIVTTGVVVVDLASGDEHAGSIETPVTLRAFGDDEIDAYIATGDPFDKAGSYAIQHSQFQPVARIDGCATNVIGLPLCLTASLLQSAGLTPTVPPAPASSCGWDPRCTRQYREIN